MRHQESPPGTAIEQLDTLLAEPGFVRIIELVTREVARAWRVPGPAARGFVLSAIGEPATLAVIARAWLGAGATGKDRGLAKVIVRRRVIDLLRKDARSTYRGAPASMTDLTELERAPDLHAAVERDPRAQLELQEVIRKVRDALACFAAQGPPQARQARLLEHHTLDEVSYDELGAQLACSEGALRVRVHKALRAFRKHVLVCHTDLEGLVGGARGAAGGRGVAPV